MLLWQRQLQQDSRLLVFLLRIRFVHSQERKNTPCIFQYSDFVRTHKGLEDNYKPKLTIDWLNGTTQLSPLQRHKIRKFKMGPPLFVFQHTFPFKTTLIRVFFCKLRCCFHYPASSFGLVFNNVTVWKSIIYYWA